MANTAMFTNKLILSPMVRVGCLPFRLVCLKYGADLAYAEEVIGQRLCEAIPVKNDGLGTMDFLDPDGCLCFRTCDEEKDKVVFQMGVSDAETAVKTAQIIQPYVAAIDVNMGCPKSYSIKGNMGAALLTQPELVKDILTSLVNVCTIPVTCKIRILQDEADTLALCQLIESTGVSALTVHGRTRYTTSRQPCDYEIISKIKKLLKIPVILNGASLDVKNEVDMRRMMSETGVDGVMLARAAWSNPSVFRKEGPLPIKEVVTQYMKYCITYEVPLHILKYTIVKFKGIFKDDDNHFPISRYITCNEVYKFFGLEEFYENLKGSRPENAQTTYQKNKRVKLSDPTHVVLTCEWTPEILQSFRQAVAPLQMLNQWFDVNGVCTQKFSVSEHNRTFTGFLKIDGETFVTDGPFKNKKMARQAVAYAYMIKHNIEIRYYKRSCNSLVKDANQKIKCTDENCPKRVKS